MNDGAVFTVDDEAIVIGDLYRQARASAAESVRCLIEVGHRLAAIKESLPHGAWLPWLAANAGALGFDSRVTAARLIRAAEKCVVNDTFEPSQALRINREIWGNSDVTHRTAFTGETEWYTPVEHLERARRVLGAIDLDPASSAIAQERVNAAQYFTRESNGLARVWRGRIWLNPPYAQPAIEDFVDKLVKEVAWARVAEAILLTHNYTDTAWFHKAAAAASLICFTRGRIAFEAPTGERAQPTQGQAFFYFGPNHGAFASNFADVGFIVAAGGAS